MTHLLLVMAGGAAGSTCRYLIFLASTRLLHGPPWWSSLTVNIVGSFALGILTSSLFLRSPPSSEAHKILLGTGFLGGFTTFSAFSLEVSNMILRRAWWQAGSYGVLSLAGTVTALLAGLALGRLLRP